METNIGEVLDFIRLNKVEIKKDIEKSKLLFVNNLVRWELKFPYKKVYSRYVIGCVVKSAGANLNPEDQLLLIDTILERPLLVEFFCEIN